MTWSTAAAVETNKGMTLRETEEGTPNIQTGQWGTPSKVPPALLRTQTCPYQWFVCLAGAP